MKILFLDDNAERHAKFKHSRVGMDITQAWNYAEACAALSADVYDVAYLDHDLNELSTAGLPTEEKTGTHVAEFIASMPEDKRPKYVIIHSWNYAGALRMLGILSSAGVACMTEAFRG